MAMCYTTKSLSQVYNITFQAISYNVGYEYKFFVSQFYFKCFLLDVLCQIHIIAAEF